MKITKESFFGNKYISAVSAIVCCLLWGSAFACIKKGYEIFGIGDDYRSQILFAGIRFFIAGVMVIVAGSIIKKKVLIPKKQSIGYVGALALTQTVMQYVFFYIGLAHTTGVNASVINGAGNLFTIVIACLIKQDKITVRKAVGCILGFGGVLTATLFQGVSGEFSFLGEGFILISAVSYGFSGALIKKFSSKENPVYVHITVANRGTETLRFKLADDRMFSIDFKVFDAKNKELPATEDLIRKRTMQQTVYFREIALESGEEYSFTENLKDYVQITQPSIYYMEVIFYPELYKSKFSNSLVSNRMSLEIRPTPSAAGAGIIPVTPDNAAILQPERISPDKVVEQTIIARQRSLWDQFFLYMDLEEMLQRDPVRARKYKTASAIERARMLDSYKADLQLSRIDGDVVAIPERFTIDKTEYTQTEGIVTTTQWFKYNTFYEKKQYVYYVRQRDGIWQIYDYTVENLGTE